MIRGAAWAARGELRLAYRRFALTAPRGAPVTSRIGYVGDDDDDDEDRDEMRYRAFTLWAKHGDRCDTGTLRLALEYAQDSGDPVEWAISSALSRKRS